VTESQVNKDDQIAYVPRRKTTLGSAKSNQILNSTYPLFAIQELLLTLRLVSKCQEQKTLFIYGGKAWEWYCIYIRPDVYLSFHAQHFGEWSLMGCPEKKAKKIRREGGRKE
jgi:hypothetical protein